MVKKATKLSPSTRSVQKSETKVKLEHDQDGEPSSIVGKFCAFRSNTRPPLITARFAGATDSLGELAFLLRWPNGSEQLVPATTANLRWPQLVIAFYETRISWHDAPLSASQLRAGRAAAVAMLAASGAAGRLHSTANIFRLKYL